MAQKPLSSLVSRRKADKDDDELDALIARIAPSASSSSAASSIGKADEFDLPTFEKNPIAAWGLVLQAFSAGFRGEESTIDKRIAAKKARDIQEQALEFKRNKLQIDGLKFMAELAGNKEIDPALRSNLLKQYGKLYSEATGMDPKMFEGIEKFADPLRRQIVAESATAKVKAAIAALRAGGGPALKNLTFGDILEGNLSIPEDHELRLDEDELRALLTNPAAQQQLGLIVGENAEAHLKAYVTTLANKRAAEQAEAEAFPAARQRAIATETDKARIAAAYREPPGDIIMAPPDNPTGGRMVTPGSAEYEQLVARGWVKTAPSQVTGDRASFAVSRPEMREWRQAYMGTMNYVQSAVKLRDLVQDNVQALFIPGGIAQFANAFAATAEGLIQLSANAGGKERPTFYITENGKKVESTSAQMLEKVSMKLRKDNFFEILAAQMRRAFQNTAIDAKQIEALIINLAYADAVASEGGAGRLSDQDIEKSIKGLGVSADPEVFGRGIENAIERQIRQLYNRAAVLNASLPPEQQIKIPTAQELGYTPPRKAKSAADDKGVHIGMSNGKRVFLKDGKRMVEE